jgi:hypothetical protein
MQEHEKMEDELSFKSNFVPLTTKKALSFLIIIGLLIFFLSLFNNFVGDDNTQIIDNPSIQSLQNVPTFFFENRLDTGGKTKLGGLYYKPLLDMSYALTYSLFGLTPFFYHFFQLILYIINACLLFLLFKHFFDKRIAFLLSLVFLIHPINSETAFYIADTQDVLFLFFGLIALLILTKYQSQKALIITSVCLLFSLLSKETGSLFLLILLLYAFIFKRKIFYPLLGYVSIVVVLYSLLRVHALGLSTHSMISAPIEKLSLISRLINIPSIFFFYLKTFMFPLELSGSWQWAYTQIDVNHFVVPLIFDLLFFAVITYFAFILYKKYPRKHVVLYIFFTIWFLIGLLFHSQIFPLDQTVADRWFYFPIVGLLGMVGILLETFHISLKNKWIIFVLILLILLLSMRTFIRSFDWRDDFTLASHDSKVFDTYNSEYIISHTYYEEGMLNEAKIHAERSIALFPYITNYTNLGAIDSRMGDYKNAKIAYLRALHYGDGILPYQNLASLSYVYGDSQNNIDFIKNIALKKYPKDGILWFDLAVLEYRSGNKTDAKSAIRNALLYNQDKDPNVEFINDIISQNKQLSIQVANGNLKFY